MVIEKPSWLRDALDSGWLNWKRGDWVDWWIVVIPPFSFTPGKWVETAIDWLLVPVNYTWDQLISAWRELGKVWNWIWDCGVKVYNWWLDVGGWLWGQLTGVFEWVTSFVVGIAGALKTWFLETLPGYFADFGEWVWDQLDELDAIWESKWSPLKPVIDFWTWYGKQLVDFTSDPVGYLAAALGAALEIFLKTAGWPFLRVIEAFLIRIWDEEE